MLRQDCEARRKRVSSKASLWRRRSLSGEEGKFQTCLWRQQVCKCAVEVKDGMRVLREERKMEEQTW